MKYLQYEDRKLIERRYRQGARPDDIARLFGVCYMTVKNELKRGYTGERLEDARPEYSADIAQRAFIDAIARRGRHRKEA